MFKTKHLRKFDKFITIELSVRTTNGVPNVANNLSNFGMTALAEVHDTGSTNGNLE
jgi:hypothetical protein